MGDLPQLRKGYLKLQRQGSLKLAKQKNERAPERRGLWAFPWPYFDQFFTYHRYLEFLPKHLRDGLTADPRYYERDDDGSPIDSLEGYTPNEYGYYDEISLTEEWYLERERWIRTHGPAIDRRRVFWYRGPIYTHLSANKEVLWDYDGRGEWDLTTTTELHRRIIRGGGRTGRAGASRWNYSCDHLEVFIGRGGSFRSTAP